MTKLFSLCALGVAFALPASAQQISELLPGERVAMPSINNPLGQLGDFANVDALPTFPSRFPTGLPNLTRSINLNAPTLPTLRMPGLGTNTFGLELPSLSLRSPGASFRFDGLNPFGGVNFSPRLPSFNVGMPNFSPTSVLNSVPNFSNVGTLMGGAGLFGSRKGKHTSTSLPFLDTRNAGDLAYKIEAVKICEAALKELKDCPDNSVGGFKMMPFLYKLIKSVSSRQKGMVNGMLVLIVVPYVAALAASFGTSPTVAMDATFPAAKRGITTVIEQTLKKYGRIGAGTNIQNYASQLSQGVSHLASIPGQAGNLAGQAQGALNTATNLPGTASSLIGQNIGGTGFSSAGSTSRLGQFLPPLR